MTKFPVFKLALFLLIMVVPTVLVLKLGLHQRPVHQQAESPRLALEDETLKILGNELAVLEYDKLSAENKGLYLVACLKASAEEHRAILAGDDYITAMKPHWVEFEQILGTKNHHRLRDNFSKNTLCQEAAALLLPEASENETNALARDLNMIARAGMYHELNSKTKSPAEIMIFGIESVPELASHFMKPAEFAKYEPHLKSSLQPVIKRVQRLSEDINFLFKSPQTAE